jgi:hypothetical protein
VRPRRPRFAVALAAVLLLPGAPAAAEGRRAQPPPAEGRVNREAQLIAEFGKRVAEYLEVHTKADRALTELPASAPADQVVAHQRALAQGIERSRARAKQGDIFTSEIRAHFRRQIGRALAAPDGREIRASIMEENPGAVRLRVNGRYPDALPVTTMPPQILAALPRLPKELEYRFVGQRLVLLDVHAQLVVDYMDSAIPR